MARSDSVQFKYREILVDPTIMSNICLGDAIYEELDHEKLDELVDLSEALVERIKYLIDNKLTERQTEVVKKIYFEQKTQMEVADSLGLCQTTIHKILKGNLDYSNGGKRYGGALKKLRKLCAADEEVQSIMNRMSELRSELYAV